LLRQKQAQDGKSGRADTYRQQQWLRIVHIALQELKHALLEVLVREVFDHWMSEILLPDDSQQLVPLFLEERQECSE